jgi:hypothetical protein
MVLKRFLGLVLLVLLTPPFNDHDLWDDEMGIDLVKEKEVLETCICLHFNNKNNPIFTAQIMKSFTN